METAIARHRSGRLITARNFNMYFEKV